MSGFTPDTRFYAFLPAISVVDIIAQCDGEVLAGKADPASVITTVGNLQNVDNSEAVVFADTPKALSTLSGKRFGVCLCAASAKEVDIPSVHGVLVICDDPRHAFASFAAQLHADKALDTGDQNLRAALEKNGCQIHPTALLGADCEIGANVVVGPYSVIGNGVSIADDCIIGSHVTIECALIGQAVRVKSGARIGQRGFGFVPTRQGLAPAPQLGRVILEDFTEIGANTTIDRGGLADTCIGRGSKLDNLIQIGHNVVIGEHCVFASQVGVSGSTHFGDGVQVGGKAGFADHLSIGSGALIAAKAGVMSNIPPGEKWGGFPARRMTQWLKETAFTARAVKSKKKD